MLAKEEERAMSEDKAPEEQVEEQSKKKRGRPFGSRGKCSLCGQVGHYKPTCPEAEKSEEAQSE